MKKRILVFNGYYTPAKKYGGPTTSLKRVVETCSFKYDFYIVAANHDLNEKTVFDGIGQGWNDVGGAKVLYVSDAKYSEVTEHLTSILVEVQPDLVWIIGILVPIEKWPLAAICRKKGIRYLISPRGEVTEGAFRMKYVKKRIVSGLARTLGVYKGARYHATDENEKSGLMKYYGAKEDDIYVVPNIAQRMHAELAYRTKHPGSIDILFLSRIQEKKGLHKALQAISRFDADTSLDIYGPLESQSYWMECKEIISSTNGARIKYRGMVDPEHVSDIFSKYQCFVFPTLGENYGHVVAESLSQACPVVLSKGTTPWDSIDGVAGYTFDGDNINDLCAKIEIIRQMDQFTYDKLVRGTAAFYDARMKEDDSIDGHLRMFDDVISAD